GGHVAEAIQAYRRDARSDADQRQRARRLRWRDSDLGEVERLDGDWRRTWLRKQPHDTGDDPPHNKHAGRNRDPAVDRSKLHAGSKPRSRSRRSHGSWRGRPGVSGATQRTSPNVSFARLRWPRMWTARSRLAKI